MTAIHHKLQIEAPGAPPVQSQGASGSDQGGMPLPGSVDPLLLAFYYLLEASNTTDNTAMIHAKQLNQNAQSQQKLNADLSQLQRESVPHLQTKHHTTYICHYYFFFWWFTKKTWVTHPNQVAVDQAQAVNQELSVQRQMLSDKMATLEQDAKIVVGSVNSDTDEAQMTAQQGSQVLEALKTLTFNALMRHAPQG